MSQKTYTLLLRYVTTENEFFNMEEELGQWHMPLDVGDIVMAGWLGRCWGWSWLVVDWPEAADDRSIHEEEKHGSSTFVVVALVEDENMAADRNIQRCWVGERGGGGMVDCLLWRRRTRSVYVLRSLRQMRVVVERN